MPENDKKETPSSLCSEVETIVINGTNDLATPVENVESYLANKSCAKGSSKSLIVKGGGHSSLTSMKCLSSFIKSVLSNETSVDMGSCELPVSIKTY